MTNINCSCKGNNYQNQPYKWDQDDDDDLVDKVSGIVLNRKRRTWSHVYYLQYFYSF